MFTNLSAVQINRLAQRLREVPLGRSASVAAWQNGSNACWPPSSARIARRKRSSRS